MQTTVLNSSKFLSDDEVTQLNRVLESWSEKEPRNVLMIRMLLKYGMRISELLELRKRDVDPLEFRIKGSKGGLPREFPLSKDLALALAAELKKCESLDDRVFPILYNRARDIWADYRPVRKRIHSLRHTFAVRLYLKTKDIRLVQRALGHKHLATTLIYQEFFYTKESFKQLLDE